MAEAKRFKITDEGIANLCSAINQAAPEQITPPPAPSVSDIGGKDIFAVLGPVAFLTRATVEGRQTAISDLIKRLRDGNTQMCIVDQALGPANVPTEPIVNIHRVIGA